jgi:hypothetical protein
MQVADTLDYKQAVTRLQSLGFRRAWYRHAAIVGGIECWTNGEQAYLIVLEEHLRAVTAYAPVGLEGITA